MAQQDTGLGWSAEAEYLIEDSIQIASVGRMYLNLPNADDQPIPVTGGAPASVVANGKYMLTADGLRWYIGASSEGAFVAASQNSGTNRRVTVISKDADCVIYLAFYNQGSGSASGQSFNHYDYVTVNGNRWYTFFQLVRPSISDLNLPITSAAYSYSDVEQARIIAQNVVSSADPINKTNEGYTIACIAKWYTQNGTELCSPVTISSNTEYTDMDTQATGFNYAELNYLLSGTRFYMGFWDIPATYDVSGSLVTVDLRENGNITLDQLFMYIVSTSYAHIIIISSPDPYSEEGAGSGEEGGDGEELEDDEMGISHHAIPAAINTGFCRIYCPSEQQLRDLSNFLWSAQFDLTAVKKLFANPMDSVLGLSAVPLNLSGANAAVYLGGVDTEMSFPMVSYQSYQVPMGAITVEKRWGSYLDYDPYTKFSIYLPFIGFKDLSADDIMGKQIILDYDVDILSGACTARLQAGANVLYQWSGQCSIQLPVTASNWNQVFQNATSAALSAGLAVATGSAGPVLAGALAAEGAQAIMGKPRIERGGTASGAAGWMGGLTPYLVRVTPEAVIPSDQNKFIGYPAFSSISLGALTGYNEIASIHLEGIPATGAELDELETILKGGVIF